MSRDFKLLAAVLISMIVGVLLGRSTNTCNSRQLMNMEVAKQELPRVEAVIRDSNRFQEVNAFVYTGQGGAMMLHDFVESKADLFGLMNKMGELKLSVTIVWQVRVLDNEDKSAVK